MQQCETGTEFRDFQRLNRAVDQHRETSLDWLERHQDACAKATRFGRKGRMEVLPHLYQRVRDDRNFINAADYLIENGGPSKGPDGKTVEDITTDRFDLARQLRDAIDRGVYAPSANRIIQIPKSSGRGVRQIHIPSIDDRVVYRGIVQVLSPILDTTFLPTSFGSRPNLDRRHALAYAEFFAMERGTTVWLTVDIADAFAHVPRPRLFDVLHKQLPIASKNEKKRAPHNRPIHESLHGILEKVITAQPCPGLPQGMSTSPLFFNTYTDHFFDRPWKRAHPHVPALRYVDDINVLRETLEEAEAAMSDLEQILLPAGFSLKLPKPGESLITDLRNGEECVWLGYAITCDERGLVVRMSPRGWERIYDKLAEVPPLDEADGWVAMLILSVIKQLGPTFPHVNHREFYKRIADISPAVQLSMPTFEQFMEEWDIAFRAWERLRKSVRLSLSK